MINLLKPDRGSRKPLSDPNQVPTPPEDLPIWGQRGLLKFCSPSKDGRQDWQYSTVLIQLFDRKLFYTYNFQPVL